MNIKQFNENFKKLYESIESQPLNESFASELRDQLTDTAMLLSTRGSTNIKEYEIAFQETIENMEPDKSWWDVTELTIFWDLFENRDVEGCINRIIDNLKPEYKDVENTESQDDDLNFDESLVEALESVLHRINESPISDEDKRDSDLIRGMLSKMKDRSNAKFSPEEKAVMQKYGIKRDNNGRNLEVAGVDLDQPVDKMSDTFSFSKNKYSNGTRHKINYADRARKIPDRIDNQPFGHPRFYASNADVNAHGGGRTRHDNLLDAQRSHQAAVMGQPVSQMKRALGDRKYHKDIIDRSQADYDAAVAKAKAEYDRAMTQAEKGRADRPDGYHMTSLNHANKTIDTLLNKEPKTESMESSGYFKVTYDSNGVASAVMVKANSEEEAREVYNEIKGSKFPTIHGVVELYPTEVETNKKKGMSCLN